MKTLIKTKLLDGKYLEVRDYEMGQDLKIIHCTNTDHESCSHDQEEFMKLTVKAQKKGKVTNTQQSKFYPYKYYKMYKFLWKPAGVHEHIERVFRNLLAGEEVKL